jgi:hypothetical protein
VPFSIGDVAPKNKTKPATFRLFDEKTDVEYYPNRITLEGATDDTFDGVEDDGDEDRPELSADERAALRSARNLCYLIHSWDWVGKIESRDGTVVVDQGEPVPIDPEVVRLIPVRITKALSDAIVEKELGNRSKPRR